MPWNGNTYSPPRTTHAHAHSSPGASGQMPQRPDTWSSMTAGQKAAWTRRARASAGIPPTTPPRRPGRTTPRSAWGPRLTAHDARLAALAALQSAAALSAAEDGVTPEKDKAFD